MTAFQHAQSPIKSTLGEGTLHTFAFGDHEEDNILVIEAGTLEEPCIVRVQSACYTAEIFRSTDCDCHAQLKASLSRIFQDSGLFVYMIQDGRGAGLLVKTRGLALSAEAGLTTYEAYRKLGVEDDPRKYGRVCDVLRSFDVTSVTLLTNNPRKVDGLRDCGFQVERESIEIVPTEDSLPYLKAKRDQGKHLLDLIE